MKKKTYAVLGLGRFGMPLATKLAQSGADVIGVDMDEERVRAFREYSEYAFVAKKLTKEVLEDIGIQDCDVAVICIGSRVETSILVTEPGGSECHFQSEQCRAGRGPAPPGSRCRLSGA